MAQMSEYRTWPFIRWCWRTRDFTTVTRRRTLERTGVATLLLAAAAGLALLQITIGVGLGWYGWQQDWLELTVIGVLLVAMYPFIVAHLLLIPLVLGRLLIIGPREVRAIGMAETIFASHPGIKIAIAGSYGKTTMKELLLTVLQEGKRVVATPANKNVAIAHAQFARSLHGDEEILIIEYGEGKPGDVPYFIRMTHPSMGIITGLAPAHLDRYKTLHAAGEDIFSLAEHLKHHNVYINGESEAVKPFIKPGDEVFDRHHVLGWKIANIEIAVSGTSFTMSKGPTKLKLTSQMIGRHQVGPLAFVAALALRLGLTDEQVKAGIAKTAPFEHRMQPRFFGGAVILDDTYNGNIEGIKAGLALLEELPATRKWYITPGLVEQGAQTESVHIELGRLLANAAPDIVVLMQNSTTTFIQQGLQEVGFKGELRIETNPLAFYQGIEHILAAGDLVLMQNDWTDNYA